ncbi:hypothetical protein DAPPUDRAFT_267963 [Daphnia pulex]|uniref:JmjC domain-containing protein n=1 Tax=Daphnia pulex TaxID=6669 RepID=E9HX51_DAPPU|nr:hypothetical protein DAPPUDRAFT_267963 [Daphnia pulex]|eukprot:EFX63680.1 hypothetical protein DAPPUDRAFT_267963 [Daphnia pulex]
MVTLYLLVAEEKLNIPGIDTVELFNGEAASLTGWHVEDLNFGSYLANLKCGLKYLTNTKTRHKTMVLLPQELLVANIPFRTLKQLPGDYVITLPAGFHFVKNSGSNIAEATNYVSEDWVEHRKTFPRGNA